MSEASLGSVGRRKDVPQSTRTPLVGIMPGNRFFRQRRFLAMVARAMKHSHETLEAGRDEANGAPYFFRVSV
jgi:hypothetical protein